MSAGRTSYHWIPPRGQIFIAHPEAGSCCWWLAWWDGEGVNKKVFAASTVRGTIVTSELLDGNQLRCPPRGQSAAVNMMWMTDEGIRGGRATYKKLRQIPRGGLTSTTHPETEARCER
ncbi:hypothetical protein [Corynebacterium sp. UMB10119B.1]|uniref:hypothetical protein n=1 Tax=Corynebacterium sp. UMB10119B.1 TaxID=3050601 RepID=UPI00254F1982|nr:hypothetical protein [Corynebacterium sp. UMB10119B]MDK8364622.1 hypothetical protein [Corynebacterium sp. UMB10119B]